MARFAIRIICPDCNLSRSTYFYYEPEAEKVAYKESRTKYPLIAQMTAFMKANKMWFFLLLILPSGFSSAYALINPMLVDAGWSIANIGIATKFMAQS